MTALVGCPVEGPTGYGGRWKRSYGWKAMTEFRFKGSEILSILSGSGTRLSFPAKGGEVP